MSTADLSGAVWRKSSRSGSYEDSCVEVASVWRKSTRSGAHEDSCVEVASVWRKSTRSGGDEGSCVEVAGVGRLVAARDSKDPAGPVLCFGQEAWRSLCTSVKSGSYDL